MNETALRRRKRDHRPTREKEIREAPGPSWKIENRISEGFEIYEAKSFQRGKEYALSIVFENDRSIVYVNATTATKCFVDIVKLY